MEENVYNQGILTYFGWVLPVITITGSFNKWYLTKPNLTREVKQTVLT